MARGTGLPIPKTGDVLSQPINVIDADRYSSARSWAQIASAGAEIAKAGSDAARVAQHQSQVGYFAEQDVEIARKRIELRDKNAHNPAGFDAEWKGYTDGKLGEAPTWAIPHLRRVLGGEGNAAYSAILGETRARDMRLDGERVNAAAKQAGNDVIGAAMAGTLRSPDGALKVDKFKSVLLSGVTSGLHSQEWADERIEDVMSRAEGEIGAREGLQVYREKGFEAAVGHLRKNILENEQISLTAEQKQRVFGRAMAAIRLQQQEDRVDRAGIEADARDLEARITSGQPYDPGELRDTAGALLRVGALRAHRSLVVADATRAATRGASLPELAAAAHGARAVASNLTDAVKRFEGFTPAAKWDFKQYSSGYGTRAGSAGERIDEATAEARLNQELAKAAAIVDRVNPNLPAGARDAMISLTFNAGADWVNAELGERIRAGDMEGAKARFVQYNRAGGEVNDTLVRRRAEEVRWFDTGGPSGGAAPAPSSPYSGEVAKRVQGELVKNAKAAWPQVRALIDSGKPIDDEDFEAIRQAAALSGDQKWQQDVESAAVASRYGTMIERLPVGERQAALDQLRAQLPTSGLPAAAQEFVQQSVTKQVNRLLKTASEDPVTFHIERGGMPPEPINFGSPQQAAAAVADRVAVARGVAATERIPLANPFRESERQSIASAIASGDTRTAVAAINAVGSVPAEFADATFSGTSNPIREALAGAAVSADPEKMTAANATLDRYWRTVPNNFARIFGKSTLDHLQVWQGLKDAYAPAELAEYVTAARDPKQEAARKALDEPIRQELKSFKVDGVANTVAKSWVFQTPRPVNFDVRGVDGLMSEWLMAEHKEVYTMLRKSGVPAHRAHQDASDRLATTWGVSVANQGALMRLPPEKYYPTINGTHDWLKGQVDDVLLSASGVSGEGPLKGPLKYTFQSLVADADTEADITQGRPPSYLVIVKNGATGRDEVLTDGAGKNRITFDPRPDIAVIEKAERERRAAADTAAREAVPGDLAGEAGLRQTLRLR